jgi:hypothetical protein
MAELIQGAVSFCGFAGFLFLTYCCGVGAYIVLRWGVTGVGLIWQRRREITRAVEDDARETWLR